MFFNFRYINHLSQTLVLLIRLGIKSLINIRNFWTILSQKISFSSDLFLLFLKFIVPHANYLSIMWNSTFLKTFEVLEWVKLRFVVVLVLINIWSRFWQFISINQINQVCVLFFILIEVLNLNFLSKCISWLWSELLLIGLTIFCCRWSWYLSWFEYIFVRFCFQINY